VRFSLLARVRSLFQKRILQFQRIRLARELEEGYRAEAASPSLDPEWEAIEVEEL
jgi:hypothetical protein